MKIKLLKKGDIIVIAAVIAAAILLTFIGKSDAAMPVAEISVDGKTVETVNLYSVKEKIVITPYSEYNIKIIAQNGEIWFEHSDCTDKLCVSAGKLSKSGDVAVCLPAKTVITVSGSDVDAVVY